MREHWRRNGPPLNVAAVAIAAALGVDLVERDLPDLDDQFAASHHMPNVSELQAIMEVKPGQDTGAASLAIARRLSGAA